jgi:hypothetical protein
MTDSLASATNTPKPTSTPLTLMSLWMTSFAILTRHFGKLSLIALIPNVLAYILAVILDVVIHIGTVDAGSIQNFLSFTNIYSIVSALLLVTIGVIMLLGFVTLVYSVVHHERVTFIRAFEEALDYVWAYIGQLIISAGVIALGFLGGSVILMILGIVLGRFSIDLLNEAFTWLSLIPVLTGTMASVFVLFAQFSIVEKKHRPMEAIRYSIRLTKQHFLRTFVYVTALFFALFLVGFGLGTIPFLGWLLSLLTLTPFTIVYLYVLYASYTDTPVMDAADRRALADTPSESRIPVSQSQNTVSETISVRSR